MGPHNQERKREVAGSVKHKGRPWPNEAKDLESARLLQHPGHGHTDFMGKPGSWPAALLCAM